MIDTFSLLPQVFGATTVRQNCTKNGLQISVDHYRAERARFRRPDGRRYLGALPGGPGNHATAQRPDGRSGRFGIRRPRASSRPPHTKTARRLRAGLLLVAERARFELAIPFWGTHAFQACLFSHSSISPIRIPGNRDCKGNHFFRKCKCRRLNFSTRGYKVRLWSMQPGYSSG